MMLAVLADVAAFGAGLTLILWGFSIVLSGKGDLIHGVTLGALGMLLVRTVGKR